MPMYIVAIKRFKQVFLWLNDVALIVWFFTKSEQVGDFLRHSFESIPPNYPFIIFAHAST